MVPVNMNVLQLSALIKLRLKLPRCKELFLLLEGPTIPPQVEAMGELYRKHVDQDGFLYFTYSSLETFG